jgi:hypothetical protein
MSLMSNHRRSSSSSEERLFPDEHSAIIRVERANMVNLMMKTMDRTTTPDLLILTHSHQVSDAVLRQQLNLLYKDNDGKAVPTIALELTRSLTASCLDKLYMIMSQFLQQSTSSSDCNNPTTTRSYTMMGLPKSGKSSLAIIAARRRRLAVKRPMVGNSTSRYGYSLMLPKDTAQYQKYVLETQTKLPDMRPMDLWDPPSTVQSDVLNVTEPLRTILQAAGCLPATPTGYALKLWSHVQNDYNNQNAPPPEPPPERDEKSERHEMVQLQILLDALHRHANRSGLRRPFHDNGTITTASAFWDYVQEEMIEVQRQEEYRRAQNERYNRRKKKNKDGEEISNVITTIPQLLRACRDGQYGPLLFDVDDDVAAGNNEDDVLDYHTKFGYVAQRHNTSLHRGDAVVGINGAALALLTSAMANTVTTTTTTSTKTTSRNKSRVSSPNDFEAATTMSIVETKEDIAAAPAEELTAAAAAGAAEPPLSESPTNAADAAAAFAELHPEQPASPFVRPRKGKKEKVVDTMDQVPIVRFPLHRRTFACMVCAGFVKRGVGKLVYGCGHTKVMSQKYEIIIAYYSRMMEAFGETRQTQYLMKDSLACTLARKHKLISRASAYKKFHGMKEFPMPNRLRPIFLRSDKPIPFVPYCSRLGIKGKKSCYDTIAGKLLDTIPNYEARANVIAQKHQQLLDDLDEEDVEVGDGGDDY